MWMHTIVIHTCTKWLCSSQGCDGMLLELGRTLLLADFWCQVVQRRAPTFQTLHNFPINWEENERLAANMRGKCQGVVGYFHIHLPQFSESTLIVFLLSNTSSSLNWCSSILFSLSSAPDNVAVTVCCLISMNCFTMIDSLTGPVIGCLVCSVTK